MYIYVGRYRSYICVRMYRSCICVLSSQEIEQSCIYVLDGIGHIYVLECIGHVYVSYQARRLSSHVYMCWKQWKVSVLSLFLVVFRLDVGTILTISYFVLCILFESKIYKYEKITK